ncbi:aspartate-alanine antiporter [Nocardioides lianchengensis]|uniref:Putative transport protein n=1 Tax=Nocardioides lianchengensis TaxID=1045774 RepID=A0A1G7C247_9ACTN|nr:aspartate-alanine antiporter [Nocardioides lianchengensis]NYG09269.1 putative transport protein [Nocardioides lianchengensis]SDE33377.1 putative transport protein [Nocardioides lianchengensis]
MWDWFSDALRENPQIAIFLTLGIGFFIGKLHFKSIVLGSVTGTLLAGVIVGQVDVTIDPLIKSVAFIAFLFALGYNVGPQFFAGLRSDGLKQLALAVISCVVGLLGVYVVAQVLGYGVGWGAGLLAGGLTQSAVIGVASSAIEKLPGITPDQIATYESQIAVGYSVCYLVGTAAAAYFLSSVAPRLVGTKDLAEESAELERKLGTATSPDVAKAYYAIVRRTYRLTDSPLVGQTVADLEAEVSQHGHPIIVHRMRRDGAVSLVSPDTVLQVDDVVTVSTRRHDLVAEHPENFAVEVDDADLLDYQVETLPLVVTNKDVAGRTIGEVMAQYGPRIFVRSLTRAAIEVPWSDSTVLHLGDELEVQGAQEYVEAIVAHFGYAARTSDATDLSYVGIGITLGCLVGLPTMAIAGADIGLTTSGGALILGLLFGYLRSRRPTFGQFPPAANWLMSTGGLCLFVGIVGLVAAPSFVDGVKDKGLGLLVGGLVVTLFPMVTCLFLGKYVFKFSTPILLGIIAGANTTTAAIGAVTDRAKSQVPVIGYTVPYAVGNVLLTIWGSVIVALLA